MDIPTLPTFAAAAFAPALTRNPDMLPVMTRSVAQGRTRVRPLKAMNLLHRKMGEMLAARS